MKPKNCLALLAALSVALSCGGLPAVHAAETGAPNYGTVTENPDGSKLLNFGQDSIAVKGNKGSIITDADHAGVLRPDNLQTNGAGSAVLTLPAVDLKNSGYDKLTLCVASKNSAAVSIRAGETELAVIDDINTGNWTAYQNFEKELSTTEAEGNITLNITGAEPNAYCGNYLSLRLFQSSAPAVTPDPSSTATPAPTLDPGGEPPVYLDPNYSFEERAADLVSRMTLDEKATQLTDEAAAIPRLGVGAYDYWSEALHGIAREKKATSFPSPLSMSNTWNRALIYQMADITSTEARAKHPRTKLSYWSPTINMARDPRWGRNEETFGEDPYLTAQLAGEFVKGMQGDDGTYLKTISTLKHFVANNVEAERSDGSSVMDETTLREYYARAFQDIIEDVHPASVMSSYNATTITRNGHTLVSRNGQKIDYIASSANSYILLDLLRRSWGFDGYVTGDCAAFANMNGKPALKKGLFRDRDIKTVPVEEVMPKAFLNGGDIDCSLSGGGGAEPDTVIKMIQGGYMTEDQLDVNLYRLFLARMKTGEFDDGAAYQDIKSDVIECDEHVAVAEALAEESWVLLKNEDQMLPLSSEDKRIVLVGPRAADTILGDYSGIPAKETTPADGIKAEVEKAIPGTTVTYIPGVLDETPLFHIKRIDLMDASGKKTPIDLSKAVITGAGYENGIITNVTKKAKITVPNVNFSKVTSISMELAAGKLQGGTISVHYGPGGPDCATIKTEETPDLDTYVTCAGPYDASGGYNGTADMELTVEPNTVFDVEKHRAELDAADVIIAYASTMWGRSGDASESMDRENINLPVTEAHVTSLTNAYPEKTVVVMQAVGQINVEPFADQCKAMLWTSYNGQTQGTAIGKVLSGQVSPSGKLTTTWYQKASLDQIPFLGTPVKEDGITFKNNDYSIKPNGGYPGRTYQYHKNQPVYPFGYGLSYTTFVYSDLRADNSSVDANGTVTFTADVTNNGTTAAKETVQLYVSAPGADGVNLPKQQLKGFDKVELNPGETKQVTIKLKVEDLRLFSEQQKKAYVPPGEYTVKLAKNAEDAGLNTTFAVTGALRSELKQVTALPDGVTVHGLICEDGTALEPVTVIDSDLTAVMTDEAWFDLSQADSVTYTSSDPEVAVVDGTGKVRSGPKEGSAVITAEVTVGAVTKSSSYPVVNELQFKPSAGEITAAKAALTAEYDKLPKTAYTAAKLAEIDRIYNAALAGFDTAASKDALSRALAKAVNDLKSVVMDNLTNQYRIASENPKFIEKGVIDYRDGGIPRYSGASGTVTNANPYTGIQLQAFHPDGSVVGGQNLIWQIQKLDDSKRRVAEIDSTTGILTVYGNGIVQITAANVEEQLCGTLMIQVNMQVEGEYADAANGVNLSDSQNNPSGGFDVGNTGDAWIEYKSIKLSNLASLIIRYAGKNSGSLHVSLAKNNADGNLIASASLAATGGWGNWADQTLKLDRAALNKAVLDGRLDQYGCATVYIQTNGTNLDYFRLNYAENNDEEPYVFDKVLNKANGNLKVSLTYRGSTLAVPVPLIAAVYRTDGTLKSIKNTEVGGTGEYTVETGAQEGDQIRLLIWNDFSGLKPLAEKLDHTYRTPVESEIVVYSLDSKEFDYSKLISVKDAPAGVKYETVNGLGGYSTLESASSKASYTYTDVNEKTYEYSFTKAWKGGRGSETEGCLCFTPKAPCKVTVVFDGNGGSGRVQKIVQNGKELATKESAAAPVAFSAEVTDVTHPVYTFGGGSYKRVYAIIVEYYGTAPLSDLSADVPDSSVPVPAEPETGVDRAVQYTTWGKTNVVLTRNDVTGETRVWRIAPGDVWVPLSTDYFYESDVGYSQIDRFVINRLAEYKGRLYAGCDGGLVIVFTDCMKCYKLKKAGDLDIREMSIRGGVMYAGDGERTLEINMNALGGDSIEADEARVLMESGGILVDVRSPEEFAETSVEGSVNIPVDRMEEALDSYGRDAVLIFGCSAGSRASRAVETAKAMGFTRVYNLGSIDQLL